MDFIWKSIILVLAGLLLIRLAGRKSISQMTIASTVVMISIGSIIVQPIVEKSVLKTIGAMSVFIGTLLLVEFLQLKFNFIEVLLRGKARTVIEDGIIREDNLKKLRLTVDTLETQLRQKGIKDITNVRTATYETNGQLGYELFPDAEPITLGDFKSLMTDMGFLIPNQQSADQRTNIFDEVKKKEHIPSNPKRLQ